MARGKHASRSVKRANEAAVAHIDRLTDKLTEAKITARQHESAARELPASRQELDRLRKQLVDGTSDALERERTARRADKQAAEDRIETIGRLVADLFRRNNIGLRPEDWGELRDLIGPLADFFPAFSTTRTARRNNQMAGPRLAGFITAVKELEGKTGFNAHTKDKHAS